MSLLDEIRTWWGWIGIDPVEVVGDNDFGNLVIKDADGSYWRLSPEECECKKVAANREELDALSRDQQFLADWYMSRLADEARSRFGELAEGRKYCLKIPGVLGGEYRGENLATAPLVDLVRMSGDVAKQIRDLPDGAKVRFKFVD
jgi:hypothetical protein